MLACGVEIRFLYITPSCVFLLEVSTLQIFHCYYYYYYWQLVIHSITGNFISIYFLNVCQSGTHNMKWVEGTRYHSGKHKQWLELQTSSGDCIVLLTHNGKGFILVGMGAVSYTHLTLPTRMVV